MAPHDRLQVPNSMQPTSVQPNGQPIGTTGRSVKPDTQKKEVPAVRDAFREVVETVVFVIVLVLLLKTFVAEAFVIPTGSMAETLLGYQKWVKCPECGFDYPVNCTDEVDPQDGPSVPLQRSTCPNCRFTEVWRTDNVQLHEPPPWSSGDRVLVSKFPYDNGHFGDFGKPHRFDVIVFKFPDQPQKGQTPMNYIKRLIGLPGETIAIYNGDLYVSNELEYPPANHALPEDSKDLWKRTYTYPNDDAAKQALAAGKFKILRKSPELMLATRRIVYDNDHQAKDLIGKIDPRWHASDGWIGDDPKSPKTFRIDDASGKMHWLRYQHLIPSERSNQFPAVAANPQPEIITNFLGYNRGLPNRTNGPPPGESEWVPDLMLEATAKIESPQGELTLELSRGPDRFQARFNIKEGTLTLWRLTDKGTSEELGKANNVISKPGTYELRFANIDHRLTVWVDGKLPFAEGVDWATPLPDLAHANADASNKNNFEPASIGASQGAKVGVSHLRLWRDIYYTVNRDVSHDPNFQIMYVQPGHYLCLGDNSAASSDSRYWGLVPERLLLGRALIVYYPFTRAGLIR